MLRSIASGATRIFRAVSTVRIYVMDNDNNADNQQLTPQEYIDRAVEMDRVLAEMGFYTLAPASPRPRSQPSTEMLSNPPSPVESQIVNYAAGQEPEFNENARRDSLNSLNEQINPRINNARNQQQDRCCIMS